MSDTEERLKQLVQFHCKGAKWISPIAGLTLFRSNQVMPPVRSLYNPRICLVLQGRKQLQIEDHVISIEAGHYLAVVVDLPVSASITAATPLEPHMAITLDLDVAAIADLIAGSGEAFINASAAAHLEGAMTARIDGDLLEPMERLVRLLDQPNDIATLAPLLQREILYRLLRGEAGRMLREYASSGSRLSRIAGITAWMKRHFDRDFEVAALAEMAGMSATTFHRTFKAATLMSPLQFRTKLRLHEARRRLSLGEKHIGRVAFDVGYRSQSQFNREYRKMFGAVPGDIQPDS